MDRLTKDSMTMTLRALAHCTLDEAIGPDGKHSIKDVCHRLRAISGAIDAIEDSGFPEPTE